MKALAAFVAVNLTTCGAAIPGAALALQHLPVPANWVAALFLLTAGGGLFIVSLLTLLIRSLEP